MPSLYETTVNTGEVSSTNFTTLYNASGLAVPNAGAGSVTGNLNVGGNLTVQGTSLLIGAVTLQDTLCLPNYCFPVPDGTTDQVLITDGSGNLYWSDVSAIPGADYNISATTVTGGANLTLANTAGFTDSVKFAGGTNITVSRTDANTITINGTDLNTSYTINASATTGGANLNLVGSDSTTDTVKFAGGTNITVTRTDADTITISTVADNIPDGTAKGQVLYWDGTAWTANSTITSAAAANRLQLQYDNSAAGPNAAFFMRKNYGATAYTTNDGVGLAFQLDSDSQAQNQLATINALWNATAPQITLNTNINNNTTGPFIAAATFSTAQATLPGDLAVNGGDITTTSVTGNLFNTNAVVVNIGDAATTEVNLGNASSGRVQIKPNTINGGNTTQNVFNTTATTVNAFGAATNLNMAASTGQTKIGNQLFITQTDVPAIFERKVTAAEVSSSEAKAGLRLYERVTDAADNNTDDAGPSVVFGRTSGATGGAERLFASMGSVWYGTDTKAKLQFNWSTDNFTEPTPGNYPQTYTLLSMGSDNSTFFNNSLYVDYANVTSTKTATSITGGNTLVFASAHGYTAGTRILYQTATANGLTQSTYYYVLATGLTTTQCQVSNTSGGTAAVLTNGTGLTLTFALVSNQVGVNTITPAYTFDVNGDAHIAADLTVDGDIYISGYQIDINSPQAGQAILFDGTKFLNSNEYEFTNIAYRSQFINNSSTAGSIVGAEFLKRRTSLVDGNASGTFMGQVVGTTETYTHRLVSQYSSTGNNQYLIQVDPVGNFIPASTTITTQLAVDNDDLFLNATDITLNVNGAASAGVDAGLTVERGTSGADATFKWTEANTRWLASNNLEVTGDLTVTGNDIKKSGDTTVLTFSGTNLVTTAGDLTIGGNTINSSTASAIELSGADVEVLGDLTVTGNDIKKSGGTTVITFSGTNLTTLAGDLQVNGNSIRGSTGVDAIEISGADVTVAGTVNAEAVVVDGQAALDTSTLTTTSTATVALNTTARNAMTGLINIIQGTNVHCLNYTALRTGATTAMLTTFGEMYNNTSLAGFTADVSGGVLRLLVTPASATSTTFSVVRTALT